MYSRRWLLMGLIQLTATLLIACITVCAYRDWHHWWILAGGITLTTLGVMVSAYNMAEHTHGA